MVLRPYLLALTEGHGPDEQLITRKSLHTGKKADRYWLMRETRRLCAEAEPPKVCVHSLRGLHATLATEGRGDVPCGSRRARAQLACGHAGALRRWHGQATRQLEARGQRAGAEAARASIEARSEAA